ncbi:MAG TPA: ankyrin repeat domain-containing protein, partial [Leucothrix mucor]|nr:ankyrin repeat domain-containing protein [Leucothrix mucor]
GDTALHTAVSLGRKNLVKALLDNGANPNIKNKEGYTPIWSICGHKDTKQILDMILLKGANINSRDSEGGTISALQSCSDNKVLYAYLKSKGLK